MPDHQREIEVAERAVRAAGDAIMARYAAAAVRRKADGSALTDADLAADRIIRETLRAACPDDAILTEEGVNDAVRSSNARCWIAGPVDGTAAFMRRTGDFDV